MEFAKINKLRLMEAYMDEKKSTYQIAEEFGTNSSKIRRALHFLGVPMRTFAESQSLAISSGRAAHPTKGKKMSKEQKKNMSESRSKYWALMSPEKKAEVSRINKEKWDAMSESEKYELRQMAMQAIRQSSSIGSKTERFLKNEMELLGYDVMLHPKDFIPNQKLEVDLFLPQYKVAVEIDGPSHFLPIWGDDKLKKQQNADIIKQGLILGAGYVLLRIRQIDKTMSLKRMNDVLKMILEEVEQIEGNFPEPGRRLIEFEVKDGQTKRCS